VNHADVVEDSEANEELVDEGARGRPGERRGVDPGA